MESEKFLAGHGFKSSDEVFDVINPYTNSVIKKVYRSQQSDIDNSLDYLTEAYKEYSKVPTYLRSRLLYEISKRLYRQREEFIKLIALETGKPKFYGSAEIDRAILTFRLGIDLSRNIPGEVLDLDLLPGSEGKTGIVKRFPLGVIFAITPWNFPINLVAHKLSPALATGNVVLLKPASSAMTCGLNLVRIIFDASKKIGLKHCPVNAITSSGKDVDNFVSDERVKMVSFTGSHEVGWELRKKTIKQKISLELGGNAGAIIEDSKDLKATAKKVAIGGFAQAGQSCIAVQRVFVNENIYEEFLKELKDETSKLKFGDPFDPETLIGPMISEDEAKRIESWVEEAKGNNAKVHTGGERIQALYKPTIISNASENEKVNAEEVFAPVISISAYKEFSEAIERVNNSKFGLQAGVFTSDTDKVFYAFNNLECGGVIINDVPTYRMDSMPYGGVKDSGNTREGVRYAAEEMTERKVLVITS